MKLRAKIMKYGYYSNVSSNIYNCMKYGVVIVIEFR